MFKYPFADLNKINNVMNEKKLKSNTKLAFIHEAIGGKFHDKEKKIMTGCAVAIVNLGGFVIEVKDNELVLFNKPIEINDILDNYRKSIGMSSFMSYLNPKNKSLNDISKSTMELKHYSVLHQINISLLITGISIGVEHEFSTQRDIIHLSRITVAKTQSQSSPCLVLPDSKYINTYKKVLNLTQDILEKEKIDNQEIKNLLFPTAKASGLIINGSLRNLIKLVELKNSGGKEDEFIAALIEIEKVINLIYKNL